MPSIISAGTTAGTALNFTADTSGILQFKTNNGVTAMTIDTSQNVTYANGVTFTGVIAGDGSGITTINASNISSGTLNSARLPASGVSATSITTGTLAVAQGGTGAASLTANNVILGNGTSAVQLVAPGTNGNVLTSNGTTWTSTALPAGGVTSLNGQTGAITNTALDAIGSYVSAIAGVTANNAPLGGSSTITYNPNSTIAGSSLRYNFTNNTFNGQGINAGWRKSSGSQSTSYGGGGSSLSGTWRAMSYGVITSQEGCGVYSYEWEPALWVRIS